MCVGYVKLKECFDRWSRLEMLYVSNSLLGSGSGNTSNFFGNSGNQRLNPLGSKNIKSKD